MNPKRMEALFGYRVGAAPIARSPVSSARFKPSAVSLTPLSALIILCE